MKLKKNLKTKQNKSDQSQIRLTSDSSHKTEVIL